VVARVEVDSEVATLEHIVKGVLQMELGYDEEVSVAFGSQLIYDPDFTDNLTEKLSDLGIKNESFITVKDDNEPDTRVNLELVIVARYAPSF
jgi:ubiquitin-like 1-activating enzyme E1 B